MQSVDFVKRFTVSTVDVTKLGRVLKKECVWRFMSDRLRILIKIGVTSLLLIWILSQIDFLKFVEILFSANILLVLSVTLVHFGSVFFTIIRWRTILGNFGIYSNFLPLTKITLIGYFFNLFLPSGIGGDFLSKREGRGMSTTLTTTVLERNAGMCALLMIGGIAAFFYRIEVQGISLLYVFIFMIAGYLLATGMLFHPWIHQHISSFLRRRNLNQWESKMELVYEGLRGLRQNKRSIGIALLTSIVIQFLSAVIVWISALSLSYDAPFVVFLIFTPLINLSIMVPFTINGIGLRESLFCLLFLQIGVPCETSVSMSLITFSAYLLTGIPGAFIYSFYKKEEKLDEILLEAEQS